MLFKLLKPFFGLASFAASELLLFAVVFVVVVAVVLVMRLRLVVAYLYCVLGFVTSLSLSLSMSLFSSLWIPVDVVVAGVVVFGVVVVIVVSSGSVVVVKSAKSGDSGIRGLGEASPDFSESTPEVIIGVVVARLGVGVDVNVVDGLLVVVVVEDLSFGSVVSLVFVSVVVSGS